MSDEQWQRIRAGLARNERMLRRLETMRDNTGSRHPYQDLSDLADILDARYERPTKEQLLALREMLVEQERIVNQLIGTFEQFVALREQEDGLGSV